MPLVECRPASAGDLPALMPVVREFYAHFEFPWDEARKRDLLAGFVSESRLGRLWVVTLDARIIGYALLSFYFSLEFDGTVALLDELFVTPTARGHGAGSRLLTEAMAALACDGLAVIRLELDRRHPDASTLYSRHGFLPDGRDTWTKRLE